MLLLLAVGFVAGVVTERAPPGRSARTPGGGIWTVEDERAVAGLAAGLRLQ